MILITVCLSLTLQAQINTVIDSLKQELSQSHDSDQMFAIYDELVTEWAETNFDSANYYADKMSVLARQIGKPPLIAKAFLRKGTAFDYFSKFDSASFYYRQSLVYSTTNQDSVGIANAVFSLAIVSQLQGNNSGAIDLYLQAEKMFKVLHDDRRLSRLYNNLGAMYRKTEQYDAAVQVFEHSLRLKEKLKDEKGILNTSINLAVLYTFSGRYLEAAVLSNKNLELARHLKRSNDEISVLISMGVIFSKDENTVNRNLQSALDYLLRAEVLLDEKSPVALKAECWVNLAACYETLGSHNLASKYLDKLALVFENLSPEAKISYYKVKVNQQLVAGNSKEAFSFLKLQTEAETKLISQKLKEKAQDLQIRYETEKKERLIAEFEVQQHKNSLDRITSSNQRMLLIAISIGLFVISGLIYFQFKQKQKSNTLLTDKNAVIENALHERETLLKEIHHRVKNNLQIISSLLSLQSKSLSDSAAQGAIAESRNRVKSMSLIHEQLYQEDTISGVQMNDYINRLVSSLSSSYGLDTERVNLRIEVENILLDVDSAIPLGLIVNELVSNSMKYAFPEQRTGSILISLKDTASELLLLVKDNGVGMDASKNSNQSFGLSMVNSLMRKLKAEMTIISQAGTSVEITIKDFKKITLA